MRLNSNKTAAIQSESDSTCSNTNKALCAMDSAMCNVRRWSSSFRQCVMCALAMWVCVRVCLCTSLDVLFGIEKVRLEESRSCTFWILFCVVLCYLQKLAINVLYIDICEYSCRDTHSLFLSICCACYSDMFVCLFVCVCMVTASKEQHTHSPKNNQQNLYVCICVLLFYSFSFVRFFILFAISTLFSWHHQKKSEQQRAFDYDY